MRPGDDRLNTAPSATNLKRLLVSLAFFLAVFVWYEVGNHLWEVKLPPDQPASLHDSPAHMNAWKLWQFEQSVGIDFEKPTQEFFGQHPTLMWFLVVFYAGPHFALSAAFLVWTYVYRAESFAYVRNAAVIFTGSAFTMAWIFPVAPPRLVTEFGMGDTVRAYLPINSGTPWINSLVNDYAAFPSVHTGWALLVAYFLVRLTRHPLRWLWFLYPAMIALSITATANHLTWDIVGAGAWIGLCELVHVWFQRKGHLPGPAPLRLAGPQPVPAPD